MSNENNPFEVAKQQKWLNDKAVSRQITQEILKFGVSQTQIRNIIFLLSLELEDVSDMKSIAKIMQQESNTKVLLPGENHE